MQLQVVCVGRRAQDPLLQAADGYLERLGRYTRVRLDRVRESTAQAEGAALIGHLSPQTWLCALDERGQGLTTRALADVLDAQRTGGRRQVAFAIGGADGLCPAVRQRAQLCLSLSPLTLPHRLALVTLLEQLYRVHTLWRGERYHRD